MDYKLTILFLFGIALLSTLTTASTFIDNNNITTTGNITADWFFGNIDIVTSGLSNTFLNLSGTNANQDINISPYNFQASNITADWLLAEDINSTSGNGIGIWDDIILTKTTPKITLTNLADASQIWVIEYSGNDLDFKKESTEYLTLGTNGVEIKASSGLLVGGTKKGKFGDGETYINQPTDGELAIVSDNQISSSSVDFNHTGSFSITQTSETKPTFQITDTSPKFTVNPAGAEVLSELKLTVDTNSISTWRKDGDGALVFSINPGTQTVTVNRTLDVLENISATGNIDIDSASSQLRLGGGQEMTIKYDDDALFNIPLGAGYQLGIDGSGEYLFGTSFTTSNDITTDGTITAGTNLVVDDTSDLTFRGNLANPTIDSSSGWISVLDNVTVAGTINATNITQNDVQVCDGSNNCGYIATEADPSWTANLTTGLLSSNGEEIEIGVTNDMIDFIGSGGGDGDHTLRIDLDDIQGPGILTTTGERIEFFDGIYIADTDSASGNMIVISKKNYNLSKANNQIPISVDVETTTNGSKFLIPMSFISTLSSTGDNTGGLYGVQGKVISESEGGVLNAMAGGLYIVQMNSDYNTTTGYGGRIQVQGLGTSVGKFTNAYGIRSEIDIEDAKATNAIGLGVSTIQSDTANGGVISTSYGVRIADSQASTGYGYFTYGTKSGAVVLDSDGISGGVLFGEGLGDARVYWDGSNLIFETNKTVQTEGSGDAYFTKNVSATGYITRSPGDANYSGNYLLNLLDTPEELLNEDGELNRNNLAVGEGVISWIRDQDNCWEEVDYTEYCIRRFEGTKDEIQDCQYEEPNDLDGWEVIENMRTACGVKPQNGTLLDKQVFSNRLMLAEYWEGIKVYESDNPDITIPIAEANTMIADEYFEKSKVYDKSKGKAVKYLKDADNLTNQDGTVNHQAFESYQNIKLKKKDTQGNIIWEDTETLSLSEEVATLRQALYEVTDILCLVDGNKKDYQGICEEFDNGKYKDNYK